MARGIDTIANRITLEGGAEILRFLDSMGNEGEKAAQKLRDAFAKSGFDKTTKGAEAGVGRLRSAFRGLDRDISGAVGKFNPLRTALTGIQSLAGGLFRGIGGGLGAGLGVGGLAALIGGATVALGRNASALKDQSTQFGINTDAIQKYQNALVSAGIPVENLSGFLATVSNEIEENGKKVKKSTQDFEVFGEGADKASKRVVKVIQGVQGLNEEGDKLKNKLDFSVPVEGLGKTEQATIKVRRGVQNVNEEVEKTSALFKDITEEQFRTGEAFDILARRLAPIENKVQALRDAGVPKGQAGSFALFLDEVFKNLKRAEEQAKKTGAAVDNAFGDGIVRGLSQEEIASAAAMNAEMDKLNSNLALLSQRFLTLNTTAVGGALEFINSRLEEMDINATKANETLEGSKSAFQAIVDLISGQQTSVGQGGRPESSNPISAAIAQASLDLDAFYAKIRDQSAAGQIAEPLAQAFRDAWARISAETPASVGTVINAIKGTFVPAAFYSLGDAVASGINTAWPQIESAARSAFAEIQRIISGIIQSIADAIRRVQDLKAQGRAGDAFGARGGSSGGILRRAFGGIIRGPGGPRGDKIPLWGSDGEFMIQNMAARKVGYPFLRMINSGRYTLDDIFRLLSARGYADGGLITALERSFPAPRLGFAAGGMVSAPAAANGRAVNIYLPGGERIAVTASDSAISQLRRDSVKGKHLRAGRKPGYYGK